MPYILPKGVTKSQTRLSDWTELTEKMLPSTSFFLEYFLTSSKDPFLVAQMVKQLPTMRETWVQSLGREDPLENEMTSKRKDAS